MPLSQGEPNALSRTYATSLFELAESEGGQESIENALGELEDVLELARADAQFGEFLSSRVLGADIRAASLGRIFEGRASGLIVRFLQVVNAKGRLSHLPAIVASLDQMVQERFGRVEVDVFTAEPVDADELAAMREQLGGVLGKEVILHPYTEAEMIGGLKIRIGDQLIDGSIASRLRKMRDRLGTHGSAEIRARMDRILDADGG